MMGAVIGIAVLVLGHQVADQAAVNYNALFFAEILISFLLDAACKLYSIFRSLNKCFACLAKVLVSRRLSICD